MSDMCFTHKSVQRAFWPRRKTTTATRIFDRINEKRSLQQESSIGSTKNVFPHADLFKIRRKKRNSTTEIRRKATFATKIIDRNDQKRDLQAESLIRSTKNEHREQKTTCFLERNDFWPVSAVCERLRAFEAVCGRLRAVSTIKGPPDPNT